MKRVIEINLILDHIARFVKTHAGLRARDMLILECGCGSGLQTLYLQKFGHVIGSDISISHNNKKMLDEIDFVQCNISDSPFRESQFDLIFSNHVLEHVEDLQGAFKEMKRIGKTYCLYAFSVPTNVWLLLSIPAQYYHKFRKLVITRVIIKGNNDTRQKKYTQGVDLSDKSIITRLFNRICPRGHGVIRSFLACYQSFKIEAWGSLFEQNGFIVKEVVPLLLYAPSEWPIAPMTSILNKFNICSSALFLIQKA